jgi:dUTP pyrophosphatase
VSVFVHFRRLAPTARRPERSTALAAGHDLYAHLPGGSVVIPPGEQVAIPTGISLRLQPGWAALITGRSGLRFKKSVDAFVGTLDADFTGEVCVKLENQRRDEAVTVAHGDRIGQLVFVPVPEIVWIEDPQLADDGHGGFGSTGS